VPQFLFLTLLKAASLLLLFAEFSLSWIKQQSFVFPVSSVLETGSVVSTQVDAGVIAGVGAGVRVGVGAGVAVGAGVRVGAGVGLSVGPVNTMSHVHVQLPGK
jgi:hypothetical protein